MAKTKTKTVAKKRAKNPNLSSDQQAVMCKKVGLLVNQGMTVQAACDKLKISWANYYRWRKNAGFEPDVYKSEATPKRRGNSKEMTALKNEIKKLEGELSELKDIVISTVLQGWRANL